MAGTKKKDTGSKRRAPARAARATQPASRASASRPKMPARPAAAAAKPAPAPKPVAPPAPPPPPRVPVKELRLLRIHGKVQGVGYRFFATRVARRLGLKGWIQNMRDGSVEALVEGMSDAIDRWIEELREGPRYAEVTRIDQQRRDFTGQFGDFDVRF